MAFSGVEYTLTFMTYDRFKYGHREQGMLLFGIGVVASLLQGGGVRRVREHLWLVRAGMLAAVGSMLLLAVTGTPHDLVVGDYRYSLVTAAILFAVASACTVTGINSLYSQHLANGRGQLTGQLRSSAQMGRLVGPLVWCTLYWACGAWWCYVVGALTVVASMAVLTRMSPPAARTDAKLKIK